MGCNPAECPDAWTKSSPVELLPLKVPQRLLHGTADTVVPYDLSVRFAKASKNTQLIPLPDAGHFELIDPRAKEWPTVLRNLTGEFLQE
jgi:pimeloyl-ACP methyl ester carboxylesterase